MRDEEYGDTQFGSDLAKELEDFSLRRGIERGGGFVGNEQRRIASNGLSKEDALSLAAAKLMRIRASDARRVVTEDRFEGLLRSLTDRFTRQFGVGGEDVSDLLANTERGMQRRGRFLKNEAQTRAAKGSQFASSSLQEIFVFEKHGAALQNDVAREKVEEG